MHQLADGSTINPSGYSLAQFVLTFYPSWSIWSDVRDLYNMLGTDDFHQRVYQLWIMALLVGYSVNGSNVDLNEQGPEIDEKNRQNISIAAAFFVAAKGSKSESHSKTFARLTLQSLSTFATLIYCPASERRSSQHAFLPFLFFFYSLSFAFPQCR